MRHDQLFLWFVGDPSRPRPVGPLRQVEAGKGVSLQYGPEWLAHGFPLSEDIPLVDMECPQLAQLLRRVGVTAQDRHLQDMREHFAEHGVCAADIELLAARLDEGTLGEQRRSFDPSRRAAPKRFRRPSPFAR